MVGAEPPQNIQALVSIYNSGDDTLWKNFLRQSDMSRSAEGVTMGRAPSELAQYITPYALSYIYSIHDYLRYGKDQQLVLDLIPGAEQILHYFSKYQMADGRIKGLPGWNFSDWVYSEGWQMGVAQVGKDGGSILMDLQLLLALQMMSEMEKLRKKIAHAIQSVVGIQPNIRPVAPNTIERSQGKAKRVMDKRKFK